MSSRSSRSGRSESRRGKARRKKPVGGRAYTGASKSPYGAPVPFAAGSRSRHARQGRVLNTTPIATGAKVSSRYSVSVPTGSVAPRRQASQRPPRAAASDGASSASLSIWPLHGDGASAGAPSGTHDPAPTVPLLPSLSSRRPPKMPAAITTPMSARSQRSRRGSSGSSGSHNAARPVPRRPASAHSGTATSPTGRAAAPSSVRPPPSPVDTAGNLKDGPTAVVASPAATSHTRTHSNLNGWSVSDAASSALPVDGDGGAGRYSASDDGDVRANGHERTASNLDGWTTSRSHAASAGPDTDAAEPEATKPRAGAGAGAGAGAAHASAAGGRSSTRKAKSGKLVRVHLGRAYTLGEWVRMAMEDVPLRVRETRKVRSADMFFFSTTREAEEFLPDLRRGQVVNRFPHMDRMAHKRALGNALTRMQSVFADEYTFFPATYCLPKDMAKLQAEFNRKKTYIYKPDGGCQGDGIFLLKNVEEVVRRPRESAVVQEYIARPLLLNKLKFDFRVYVLVTSLQPLEVYLSREGLARFCTEPYKKPTQRNLHKVYMHLTNYSLNKHNASKYVHAEAEDSASDSESSDDSGDDARDSDAASAPGGHGSGASGDSAAASAHDEGHEANVEAPPLRVGQTMEKIKDGDASKRTLSAVMRVLAERGVDVNAVWRAIQGMCARTVIAMQDQLHHALLTTLGRKYMKHKTSPCFHILGLDIMLDRKCKPWLIEVNNNPSLRMNHEREIAPGEHVSEYSPVDEAVKRPAVAGAIHIVATKNATGTMYDRIVPHVEDGDIGDGGSGDAPFDYFDMFALKPTTAAAGEEGAQGERKAKVAPPMPPSGTSPHIVDEERLMVFDRTRTVFQIIGRGENVSSSQFSRFIRKCGLMPPRSTSADLDLLFIKATKKPDSSLHARQPMGVVQFSDALMDLAARHMPEETTAERLTQLLEVMEEVVDDMLDSQQARTSSGAPSMMRR